MIKAILFDLDGTLLPMDQDEFTKGYFKLLAAKLAPYGYEPKTLIDTVWAGTAAMVKNTGAQTNEAAFWERFSRTYGAEKTERGKRLLPSERQSRGNGRKAPTARLPRRARHKSDFPEHRNLRPHPLGRARAGGFRVCNDL